jgi:molybdopterin-guanine dinucleotide biosynthesis protein A
MHVSCSVPRVICGIFVGGGSVRMGGQPKGLLRLRSGETLVARWARLLRALELPCVLVGAHDAYAGEGLPMLADARSGIGPLGGLLALLEHACERGSTYAAAFACDMPYATDDLIRRLVEAPTATAVAPRRDARWEPFFARWDARLAKPFVEANLRSNRTSLQALFDDAKARELVMSASEHEALRDWDEPSDIEP